MRYVILIAGDEAALANALNDLLADGSERERLGRNGRGRAAEVFSRERQLDELFAIIAPGFNARGYNG